MYMICIYNTDTCIMMKTTTIKNKIIIITVTIILILTAFIGYNILCTITYFYKDTLCIIYIYIMIPPGRQCAQRFIM